MPRHPSILALGYSQASMLLRRPQHGVTAIISVCGAREHRVEAGVPHRLDLCFDDVDVPDHADVESMLRSSARSHAAQQTGLHLTPPSLEDARRIIDFARAIRDVDGAVLCQCGAGISRSTAAALICLATWTGPGAERACVDELLRVCPAASPHPDLVGFGDELLGRNGQLLIALHEVLRQRMSPP
jgi:predicted protein tyrosine phosphatase